MISGGCYAIGGLFSKERVTGTPLIVGLIGKIVESPIVLDYLRETHQFPGPATAVMAITLVLDMDFVDLSLSKKPYLEALVRWHSELPREQIEAMNPTRPDILTRNGLRFGQGKIVSRDRNEYYEIKSDSPTGESDGDNDLAYIKQFFRDLRKKYKLKTTYVPGETYPSNPLKEKRLPLPLNRDFVNLASVLLRRYALTKLECSLLVRRSKPGLLQYKICFEFESDDKRRQTVLARAIAKVLAAAYVVTTVPWRFPQAELELGEHSLEGDPLPRIRCQFDVIPDLMPLTKSIEDLIFMRGIGYRETNCCCFAMRAITGACLPNTLSARPPYGGKPRLRSRPGSITRRAIQGGPGFSLGWIRPRQLATRLSASSPTMWSLPMR